MKSIHTDPLYTSLKDRTDDASFLDKDTLWLLFSKIDALTKLKAETHKKYLAASKALEREYYVKMTRLERDVTRLQTAAKTITGSNNLRDLRVEYDAEHAPRDATVSTPPDSAPSS